MFFRIHTPFGWTCIGEFTSPSDATTVCRSDLFLSQVGKLLETDSFPIVTPVKPFESAKDQLARSKVDASIKFDDTRYEVDLPWISEKGTLPGNYFTRHRRRKC